MSAPRHWPLREHVPLLELWAAGRGHQANLGSNDSEKEKLMTFDIQSIVLGKRCAVFGYLDGKPVLGGGKTFFIALRRALA